MNKSPDLVAAHPSHRLRRSWFPGRVLVYPLFFLLAITPRICMAEYGATTANWELFEAIAAGDPRRVEAAVFLGANVNEARNNQGESPLMVACAKGNLEMVKVLKDRGADINLQVSMGLTSTNAVARSLGSTKVLMYLIDNGAVIHGYGNVEPLILEVARTGNVMTARYLLIKGAQVNESNTAGWTALMSAVGCCQNERGSMEMVRLLVEWGAKVDHQDSSGQTALMRTTDPRIADYLIEKGADVNAADAGGKTVMSHVLESSAMREPEIAIMARLLLEKGARPDALNGDKRTPLMITVWSGYREVAGVLLDKGAAIEARDPQGVSALAVAAESHGAEMLKLLIDRGADVNSRDRFGVTPFMHLFNGLPCEYFSDDARFLIDLLLKAGADLNAQDANGETIVNILERQKCAAEIIDYLKGKAGTPGASSPPPPVETRTPAAAAGTKPGEPAAAKTSAPPSPAAPSLPIPVESGDATVVQPPALPAEDIVQDVQPPAPPLLGGKAREARVSHRLDQLSFTDRRFYLAMSRRDYKTMDELISQGVDINARSEYLPDGTCLLNAIKSRDVKLIAYLLAKKANVNLKNINGETPLAAAVGSRVTMKLLFGKGAELNVPSSFEDLEETPLARAVRTGDVESVKFLLSLGADVNRRDSTGSPPIMLAIFLPDLAIARLLVEAGADVNAEVPGEWTTPLMNAVVANSRPVVEFLAGVGADVNGKNIRGYSPLLLAVELADRAIIGLLIAKGADINHSGYGGTTPLIEAVILNRGLLIVEFLLARGADVNTADDNGITPLIIAVIRGQKDVVDLLLARGADVDQRDRQGKSPLEYATERPDQEMKAILQAEIIKKRVAVVLAKAAQKKLRPEQLMVKAIRAGDLAKVRELLDQGVRTSARDEETRRPLLTLAVESGTVGTVDILLERGADINDAAGTTNLHVAVEAGQKNLVEHLLAKGARVNILAGDGASPLHAAVRLGCVAELGALVDPERKKRAILYREIAAVLLDAGADVNAGTLQAAEMGDDSLWNPLHLAAYLGSPAMTELLLRWAQVDARSANGNTPLHLAVQTLSGAAVVEVVDLLLKRGANPNEQNIKNNSVLNEALVWWDSWQGWGTVTQDGVTRPRSLLMVAKLLEHGADVIDEGEYGVQPLHSAAESGLTDLAGLLIEQGATLNATDRDGNTPLYLAVRKNRTDMVRFLLRKGANRNPANREGQTPLDEARYQKRNGGAGAEEIERLLLASGAESGIESKPEKSTAPTP